METWYKLYGLLGYSLVFALCIWRNLPRLQRVLGPLRASLSWVSVVALLSFLGVVGVFFARSFFADLSMVSTVLLLTALFSFGRIPSASKSHSAVTVFFALWAVAGLILYLSALGVIGFDLYAIGYEAVFLLGAVVLVSALLLLAHQWRLGTALLVAISCYLLGLLPSVNLWDALIDPFLWLYAIFFLFRRARMPVVARAF